VIAEGDGISVIADVDDAEAARRAEAEGAAALAVRGELGSVRSASGLPILWRGPGPLEDARRGDADAYVLEVDGGELEQAHSRAEDWGIDVVVAVDDEEGIERALERVDPEIFLVAVRERDEAALEHALDLLAEVPAGKLAIADVERTRLEDVLELERAGFDGVVVPVGDLPELERER
jgi:indole-3-glycerol phosphate synthase